MRWREKEKRKSEGGKGRGGRCDREEKESEKERGRRRYVAKLDKRKKTRTVTRLLTAPSPAAHWKYTCTTLFRPLAHVSPL